MDLRDARHAVRRGWWLLVGCVLLGVAAAAALCAVSTPRYTASVGLYVSATGTTDVDSAYQGDLYAQWRTDSYVAALRSQELAGRVAVRLDLDLTAAEAARRITASAVPDTVVLEATATDESAVRARDMAAALAEEFRDWALGPETPAGTAAPRVRVRTVRPAEIPSAPVSPDRGLLLGLGASLGALVGLACTVLGRLPWNTVTDDDDVRRLTGAPVLGALPAGASHRAGRATAPGASPPAGQALRGLRANLRLLGAPGPSGTVVITAPLPVDEAVGLADDLAGQGLRVVAAPPVLSAPAQARPGVLPDGYLLTARYGRTRRRRLAEAADVLSARGVPLLGTVLLGVPPGGTPARSSYRYRADADRADVRAVRRTVEVTGV